MPAVIGGPHGRFRHTRGTDHQLWIAAGVGIAPFLSWIRAIEHEPIRDVSLLYATDGTPPFREEILTAAAQNPTLRVRLVDSRVRGRLTPQEALATLQAQPRETSVFMCGPNTMLRTFERELRAAGVARGNIHREYFDWR
jgi:predicted ferric reductase